MCSASRKRSRVTLNELIDFSCAAFCWGPIQKRPTRREMMISIEKEANQSRKTRRVEWMKLIRTKKRRCRQDLVVSFDVYQSSMYDGLCIVYTTSSDYTRKRLRTWSLSTNSGRCYTNRCITRRIFQMSEYTIRIRLEFDLTERLPIRKGGKFSIILPLWLNSQELRRDPLGRTETNTNTQNKPLSALFFFYFVLFFSVGRREKPPNERPGG